MALALDIGRIRRAFPERRIDYYPSISSTMHAAAKLDSGGVVIAEQQTAGQGRHGHTWHSEAYAGIYCSLVLAKHPVITLALGLAAAEAIAQSTGLDCDLRWPNDVMLGGRKIAGILVQLVEEKAVAGIGINVNHAAFPPELAREVTSLGLEAGRTFAREEILLALLPAIDRLLAFDRESIVRLFGEASSYARGRRVTVRQPDGVIEGVTAGLDPAGYLVVRKDDGTDTLILAGGVRAAGS
jgi:BirA family transcriptional regulator, biotin operon repressor / biotin---[acetyl-CoA-carboxylase] ligase